MLAGPTFPICLLCILLVPLALAGLCLISAGLGRSRSAAHGIFTSLCAAAIAILVYFVCGFAFQGLSGGPAHVFFLAGHPWNWLGSAPLFLRGFDLNNPLGGCILLLQMLSVALAAMIPAASAAERWRLAACCASTALLAGWTYPLFAHWVWGGGWLAQLGVNYGLGHGFIDPGGSSCIQATGGLTALAVVWILRPRRGKFTADGIPTAMPGHNVVIVLFGCLLALTGWLALNTAGAILFVGITLSGILLLTVNTVLSAVSAAIAAVLITRLRFGKPDASLSANGWIGGLVASSAVCPFVHPAEAVLVGLITGVIVIFSIELIELRLGVDDPAGAISVHAVGGLWGVMAVGIFGGFGGDVSGQLLAQLTGVATLLGFLLPLSYALNWLLNRALPQRVAPEGERQGMDLFELGAGAYPEFMIHRDDSTRW